MEVEYKFKDLPVEQLDREAQARLRQAGIPARFHWPLEFPEVFLDRGGFDAFVCNPPFVGGRRIRGTLGGNYLTHLTSTVASNGSGNADLCAFFFLRASVLLRNEGLFGLLATNTIAQGDTRTTGLERLCDNGFSIPRAVPSRKWPGTANLSVAHVWLRKGTWRGAYSLDDSLVGEISPLLTEVSAVVGKPFRLAANKDACFQGSVVCGTGFILEPEEAQQLFERSPADRHVVFPYLNAEDLNSRPDQTASRWIINFFDWPLDRKSAPSDYSGEVATDFPIALRIVEERVKPERTRKKPNGEFALRRPIPQKWWIYADKRPALYAAIAGSHQVMVCPVVSKYVLFAFVPSSMVYAHRLYVFPSATFDRFSVLSSCIHESWAREYSSTLETRINYSPTDCVDTFPFPTASESLADIGEGYHEHRAEIMRDRQEGLTDTYNRFHARTETAEDIVKLRGLHVELDRAVAAAYGWTDLDLGHGFHATKQGLRFTLSDPARREVLARLLRLNHERYAEEVAQGLHDKKTGKGKKTGSAKGRNKKVPSAPSLLGGDDGGG